MPNLTVVAILEVFRIVIPSDCQVGILSHGGAPNPSINILIAQSQKIAFNKKYSSQDDLALCEQAQDNFVANAQPNNLRAGKLDAFRDAFVLEQQNSKLPDAFDKLWKYFAGDPILEAKLNLLHTLLVPPNELSNNLSQWNELKITAKYNDRTSQAIAWAGFIQSINGNANNFANNPFDEKYIKPLTTLRNVLLVS